MDAAVFFCFFFLVTRSSTYVFVLESLEYAAKCRHFPLFLVHSVDAAKTKVVERNVFAVFVVICATRETHAVMPSCAAGESILVINIVNDCGVWFGCG